ncbi:MAG: PadR family transcriptional regulator [Planctomycetota bacterium]|jgi:PadR family transcriptional regulator PadR
MKFESQLLKGIAPVVVLEILSRGQMYGYELSQAIEERSGDILSLGKGTLYPLLYNLEAKKLVEAKWEEAESGRKRRYYSITSEGKGQLAKKSDLQWCVYASIE